MKSLLAFVLSCAIAIGTMPLTACNSATALADVQKLEPVVVNALVLACAVSSGLPICGAMQSTIAADYSLVVKLWTDYNAAVKAGTATQGLWNDLNAAFIVFENDSAAIFAAAGGLNVPEITAIVAAAQILIGVIETLFPASPTGTASPSKFKAMRVSNFNLKAWKKDYNEKLDIAQRLHPAVRLRKV